MSSRASSSSFAAAARSRFFLLVVIACGLLALLHPSRAAGLRGHAGGMSQLHLSVSNIGDHRTAVRVVAVGRQRYASASLKATPNGDGTYALSYWMPVMSADFQQKQERLWGRLPQRVASTDAGFEYVGPLEAMSSRSVSTPRRRRSVFRRRDTPRRSKYVDLDGDIKSNVKSSRMMGRRATVTGDKMSSSRTDEALESGKGVVKDLTFMGIDTLAPGLGTGLASASTLHDIHGKVKVGGGKKEVAKAVVMEGLAQANPWLGFLRDLGGIAKAYGQSDASRLRGKLGKAREFLGRVDGDIAETQRLQALCDTNGLSPSVKQRAVKAERRLTAGKLAVQKWVAGKLESGKLPLLEQGLLESLEGFHDV